VPGHRADRVEGREDQRLLVGVEVEDRNGRLAAGQGEGDAGMAVDDEARAPVDEDLLDPSDRIERAGECIGSTKFGIAAHEAPADEFPAQPSQKDGLGRMCKPHWNEYTSTLRKAAPAHKAADAVPAEPEPDTTPEPIRTRAKRGSKAVVPAAGSQGDAG